MASDESRQKIRENASLTKYLALFVQSGNSDTIIEAGDRRFHEIFLSLWKCVTVILATFGTF